MGYARGTHSRGICDRCGFEYAYLDLKKEMGTRLMVCPECDDGMYNRVDHPQNKPPTDLVDNTALRNPRPDQVEASVSAYNPWEEGDG